MYETIKWIHVTCAVISITGFTLRGAMKLAGSRWLQKKWIKITPHIVDTVLLGSAIYLATQIQQYPFGAGWLTAKFVALLVYIGLGMVVMRFGKSPLQRGGAYVLAIAVFGYIVMVARAHHPMPF